MAPRMNPFSWNPHNEVDFILFELNILDRTLSVFMDASIAKSLATTAICRFVGMKSCPHVNHVPLRPLRLSEVVMQYACPRESNGTGNLRVG